MGVNELRKCSMDEFHSLINDSGIFLEEDFNIDELARFLGVQTYLISSFLSVRLGISFSDFKNKLRIDYAVIKISEGYLSRHTTESLARICGFKSRAHFSKVFKQVIGVSIKEINQFKNRYLLESKRTLIFRN